MKSSSEPALPPPDAPQLTVHRVQLPRHHFEHRGRRMTLFKQKDDRDASWYVHFEVGKRRYKRCLETNVRRNAEERAKQFFDDVIELKWFPPVRQPKAQASSTLADVLEVYQAKAPVYGSTKTKNVWALRFILGTCGLPTDGQKVGLDVFNAALNSQFQTALVDDYVAKAQSESERREARELALRTSRSLLGQARSIFTHRGHLRELYAAAGVVLPACVEDFITAKRLGKAGKREYLAPSDAVVKEAFAAVEKLRRKDKEAYKAFWLAVGAGLRRSEIRRVLHSHFITRDARLWISGGIGKDGEHIEVPLQKLAEGKLSRYVERGSDKRFVVGGDKPARRLNAWMTAHGWRTEKKIHELRAYVGSLIYQVNPRAAMLFMRHKSIKVTEQFYVRYGTAAKPVDVL